MTIVRNTLSDPGQAATVNRPITVRLASAGFRPGDESQIVSTATVRSDAAGSYELDLVPNSQIDPAGTHYVITHPDGTLWPIVVPDGSGPFWLRDILVEDPAAPGAVIAGLSEQTASVLLAPKLDAADLAVSVAAEIDTPGSAVDLSLKAALVPRWLPNTAYTAGQTVLAPTGETLVASTDLTTGASFSVAGWGAPLIQAEWRMTVMPRMTAAGNSETPVYGRTADDGLTQGKWNLVDDGAAGDLIHIVTGPNKNRDNPNGAVIAIGIKYAGSAFYVNNYGGAGSGKDTVGYYLHNVATIDSAGSAGFIGSQESPLAPLFKLIANSADSAPLVSISAAQTMNPGTKLMQWALGATALGHIKADTGEFQWNKKINAKAIGGGDVPTVGVQDEVATYPTETWLGAKTTGDTGLFVTRSASGSGDLRYRHELNAQSDRMKWRTSTGAAATGAWTMNTVIEVRAAGSGQIGFWGVTPINRPSAVSSPAADVNSLKTAVDAIRVALTGLGLTQ